MTEEGLRAGAERIVAARAAVAKLDGLPDAERPRTIEDGYRLLQIAAERWADEPVGWKVGATSREVQAMFGIAEPVYGPMFKTTVHASPARLQAAAEAGVDEPFSTCCWRPSSRSRSTTGCPRAPSPTRARRCWTRSRR